MRPILHADETYYTVLESKTIKTYYWVFLSGKHDQYGITLYHHDPSRSGKVALNFLGNYPGYLHCDMWQAYEQLPKATLVGCWAHVRRKFHEAVPQQASEKSLAQKDSTTAIACLLRTNLGEFEQTRTLPAKTSKAQASNARVLQLV